MKPQTLLFIDHAPALGGAEHSLLMILEHLDRARFEPHLACTGGPLAERAAALDIPIHVIPLPRLRRSLRAPQDLWAGIQALTRTVRESEAALLIANTVRAGFYAAPAARLMHAPFVWYRRDFWLGESQPRLLWGDTAVKALLCAAATRIIANSHATARRHPCQRKITVVHNGIEIRRFDPTLDGTFFRQKHGIPLDAPVVGMVGRLCAIKGQARFLHIIARVLQNIPETWGVLVGGPIFGEDNYQVRLQQLAHALGIAQHVVFTGQLSDPTPALAAMDVFIQPGDPEAFGLVNVEAMAMGKPVVAFSHGALPEIVVENETGFLIPSCDEAAMAEAIIALLRDPVRRAAMGQAGRARAETHFAIVRTVREVETVLETVL
ncbi:MAG: glycosyltransferase family 4 protein [Anaerolineae bacterium]|nr:glycosyltransferase family 4 protein [Anaerolineae bacterium]